MKNNKKIGWVFLALFLCLQTNAQNDVYKKLFEETQSKKQSISTELLSDVLQAAIANGIVSTSESTIKLKSTIFKLHELVDSDVVIDSNYIKRKFQRNFELGINTFLKDNSKINGVGASLKYAIVNNRDITVFSNSSASKNILEFQTKILNATLAALSDKVVEIQNDVTISQTKKDEGKSLINQARSNPDEAIISKIIGFVNENTKTDKISSKDYLNKFVSQVDNIKSAYTELENEIRKGALLTIVTSSNYKENKWDSISFGVEFLKGLGNKKDEEKPWDLYAGAFYDFKTNDAFKEALKRRAFTAKFGINKVLFRNRESGNSFLELLGSAEYRNIIDGKLDGEDRNFVFADFTLSIRVGKTLFIPVEIKYDPINANVLGFLTIKWDFISSVSKSKK